MSQVSELRALVRARQRAATKKISRLKQQKGVLISGTDVDPRVNPASIGRANSRQLRAQLNRLEAFIARPTQYVPDAQRRPVPAKTFRAYKAAERRANQSKIDRMERVGDIKLPSGMTVLARHETLHYGLKRQGRGAMATDVDVYPEDRPSSAFASISAIEKLTKHLDKSLTPGARQRRLNAKRDQAVAMAEGINNRKLANRLKSLTDEQFDIVWHDTPLASNLSWTYDSMRNAMLDEPWRMEVFHQQLDEVDELMDWSERL